MIFTLTTFILSLAGISFLFGSKMYQLYTKNHPVPEKFRTRIKRFAVGTEDRALQMLRYINKRTMQLLFKRIWGWCIDLIGLAVQYLRKIYRKAARTQRNLKGKNNSSTYLSEVLHHKKENDENDNASIL